jgi:signal peptidase
VPSWPFVKAPGAAALNPLPAVLPYHPVPDQARKGFDIVKAASFPLKTRISSPGISHFDELSRQLLSLGLGVRFRAPGTSMHPTIRHGELITVEPVSPSELKRGDIILYRLKGNFIAHRLVKIQKKNGGGLIFLLRGDASINYDAPVKPEQILGKVVCLERDQRTIDPYSLNVRIWSMLYLLLARLKRSICERFVPRSLQRQEIRAPGAKILVNSKR